MAMAIAEGNTDILQDFLSPQDGKDGIPSNILDDHGFSVLHVACMMRQNEALLLLLLSCSEELGGMLEVRDTKFRRTALHLACMKGGLQCVQVFFLFFCCCFFYIVFFCFVFFLLFVLFYFFVLFFFFFWNLVF